jgi:2-dehydro-3-deoxy-D-arabinonate dehydratase
MKRLCRYQVRSGKIAVGLLQPGGIFPLETIGVHSLSEIIEERSRLDRLSQLTPLLPLESVDLLAPVEQQEVWAAGVTYLRSKKARMEESDFSASAYDKVYEAPRPEIFFKSLGSKVSGPGGSIGIRHDAKWNVPEPELALVINSRAELAGFTIGNDMSSRDIEGENLLYLPQAKIYTHSCALGPCIALASEETARHWTISIEIQRAGKEVFAGQTSVNQLKRSFRELIDYLYRSQEFPHGAILLTGTGIVPGDDFTLAAGDQVSIEISDVGTLTNTVRLV